MRRQLAILAKSYLKAPVDFHRDVGLQADVLGKIVVRVVSGRGALLVELAIKLIASPGGRGSSQSTRSRSMK